LQPSEKPLLPVFSINVNLEYFCLKTGNCPSLEKLSTMITSNANVLELMESIDSKHSSKAFQPR
jgi:hypothetical protein